MKGKQIQKKTRNKKLKRRDLPRGTMGKKNSKTQTKWIHFAKQKTTITPQNHNPTWVAKKSKEKTKEHNYLSKQGMGGRKQNLQ